MGTKDTIWPTALGVCDNLTGELHSPVSSDKEFPSEMVTDHILVKRRHSIAVREMRPAPKPIMGGGEMARALFSNFRLWN